MLVGHVELGRRVGINWHTHGPQTHRPTPGQRENMWTGAGPEDEKPRGRGKGESTDNKPRARARAQARRCARGAALIRGDTIHSSSHRCPFSAAKSRMVANWSRTAASQMPRNTTTRTCARMIATTPGLALWQPRDSGAAHHLYLRVRSREVPCTSLLGAGGIHVK